MRRKLIYLIPVLCLNIMAINSNAQLSGTFLIGPSAPVYKTITQAVQDLYMNHGVKGPVTYNIEDGVYNEQVYIPQINNTNVTNLVTFQSLSGDSSKVIIRFKPDNDTFNYTLMLDGANFLVFKKLTFATDTVFGRVIDINNQCSFNQFINNRIIGMPGGKELVYSESTSLSFDNYNRFENNFFQHGSVGICFNGVDNTSMEQGNEIFKNQFVNQSQQAIDLTYNYAFKIYNNSISTSMGLADYTGIRIHYCRDKFYILKNKLDINNQSQPCHGISITFSDGTGSSTASLISSNFIHISSNTYVYNTGIEVRGSYKNFYYNSVHLTGNNAASIGFNDINASNINIFNNIFSNQSDGIALVLNDTLNIFCDYNDLFTNIGDIASNGTNSFATLQAWNTASNQDLHSISTDPLFFSNSDLHTKNFRLSKRGKTVIGVTDDIDGNARKSPKTDIGADEFNYKLDLGPDRYICSGSSTTIFADKGFDTYLWSNGNTSDSITIDSAGIGLGVKKIKLSVTYQTDNYSDSVLIHFINAHANLGNNKAVCKDEPVTLQATGGVKFKWNTGDTISTINFTASQSAGYSVTVTDQYGCIDSTSIWVSVRLRPATPIIIRVGGSDTLKSSVFGSAYRWFLNKSLLSDNTFSITAKVNGIYQLIVFDSACHSDTSAGFDFQKNSIDETHTEAKIILYPNPVSNILNIEVRDIDLSGSEIEIISALGEKVYFSDHLSPKIEIETSAYKKGLYILKFITSGQTIVRRFVVQ